MVPGITSRNTGRNFRAVASRDPSWASRSVRAPRTRCTMVWSVHQYQMPRMGNPSCTSYQFRPTLLAGVALVFIVVARIESVEQAGLRLRRDVVAAQVEPEAPVRRAVGPRTGLRPGGILGKPIATVVILVGGVSLGPDPVCFVDPDQLVQFHPKVRVANGVILLPPVATFPSDHPLRDSLPNVLGVGRDFYFARPLEGEEPLDRRHQLHSIVGSVSVVPEEFLLDCTESQDAGPPSRAGIAQATIHR